MRRNDFFKYLLLGGGNPASRAELETETLPFTFTSNSHKLRSYRIYGNSQQIDGTLVSVGDLVTNDESEYFDKYAVSVELNGDTTDIYLDEPLYKTDDADYIDFKEQKIIKNNNYLALSSGMKWFLQSVNSYGIANFGVTGEVQSRASGVPCLCNNFVRQSTSITFTKTEGIYIGYGGYLYIRINSETATTVEDFKTWLDEHPTHLVYQVPQSTEISVNLPPLYTAVGENSITVNTSVQPLKVYLQGNISVEETPSASLQSLNLSPNLQTTDLNNDEMSLDVMPIDSPHLQLNDISETIGGEESAE